MPIASAQRGGASATIASTLALLLLGAPGCAAWIATSMPGPANDELVETDMRRQAVEHTLAEVPVSFYDHHGMTEARYEYADGPSGWTKLRAVVYVGADVFTIFLSELIFWPLELHARDRIQRVAMAEYSADDRLASWTVRRRSGGEILVAKRSDHYEQYVAEARRLAPPGRTRPWGAAAGGPAPPLVSAEADGPIVAPVSVTTRRQTVEFEISLLDADQTAQLLVDGERVQPAADGTLVVIRSVPPGHSTIVLTALDHSGAVWVQEVSVVRSEPGRAAPAALRPGSYHALVIGNDSYSDLPPLETAREDARAVAEVLGERYGFEVELLLDAGRSQIVGTLARYRARLGPRDNLLVYYAGHGIRDEEEDHGYWLPVDARPNDPSQWIANASITRQLKAMRAKHVIVIADSCYSGTLTRGIAVPDRAPGYLVRLSERRSRTAMTSGGIEPVADAGSGAHSVFAHALLEELRANQGVLEATELFMRLRRRVALDSDQTPRYAPIVKAGHEDGDFLFVARSRETPSP